MMGAAAALAWLLLCMRWFDAAAPSRPAWLAPVPPWLLGLLALSTAAAWLARRWPELREPDARGLRHGMLLVTALAVAFRVPLVWVGSAGYLTADGALSGIVALRLASGAEHLVFVPNVAYSGSLKSHLTALLMAALEPARAFALASVFFYAVFVAGLYRLALLLREWSAGAALRAGLLAAFASPFVMHYSLSNDGNYVEVLALGTWALYLAVRWVREPGRPFAVPIGLLLGLALWCHLLAMVYVAAVGLVLLMHDASRALRQAAWIAAGAALGYLPGLIWNAAHDWGSLAHLIPGERGSGLEMGLGVRLLTLIREELPLLLGYEPGHPPRLDMLMRLGAAAVTALALVAAALALSTARRDAALRALLLLVAVNVAVAVLALPYLPSNPRYLLFLMTPLPVLMARFLRGAAGRAALLALFAFGAGGSALQGAEERRADARWRGFVWGLEEAGVRFCYADFFTATKINFLSAERVVCSAKLGPTTTEYFFEYRDRVDAAAAAALVPVNAAATAKLESRLARLGVPFARLDLMKPVLLPARKVEPADLFPDRSFPLR